MDRALFNQNLAERNLAQEKERLLEILSALIYFAPQNIFNVSFEFYFLRYSSFRALFREVK